MTSMTEARLHKKGFNDITAEEADALLMEGSHVAVFSVIRKGKGPFSVPVWYEYRDDGNVYFGIDPPGVKARLLQKAGRATITVQTEIEPYQYVMLEGEARFLTEDELKARGETVVSMMSRIFARYLEPDLVERYAAVLPILAPDYSMVQLTPSRVQGESLRVHANWLPQLDDLPKIREGLDKGLSPREAMDYAKEARSAT